MARARHRKQHRPMMVSTWLTAGATTVGVGAALLSGAALANAKPSADSSGSSSSSSSSHSNSSSAHSHKSPHVRSSNKTDSGSSHDSGSSSASDSGSGSSGTSGSSSSSDANSASASSNTTTTTKSAKPKRSNNKHAKSDSGQKSAAATASSAGDKTSDTSPPRHAKPTKVHVAAAATTPGDTSATDASARDSSSLSPAHTAASALSAVSASATSTSSSTTSGGASAGKVTTNRSADLSGVLSVLAAVGQALSVSVRNTELTLSGDLTGTVNTLTHDLTGTVNTVSAAATALAAGINSLAARVESAAASASTTTSTAGTVTTLASTDTTAAAGTSTDPQVAQAITEIQQAQAAYAAAAKTGNWWVNFSNSMSARYLSGALNRLTTYQANQTALTLAYEANPTSKNLKALQANEALTTTAYSNLKTAASWSKIADVKTYATAASTDAHIYATVKLGMYLGTEPIVRISINGGPMVKVLLDSGSTGLVIASKYVGKDTSTLVATGDTGTSGYGTGTGTAGVTFDYATYATTVSFGSGITTGTVNVNVVSADTQSGYLKYIGQDGVVGVLGIGTNAVDNQTPVTSGLLGELGNGVYINEKTKTVTFGPNPLPVKVSASGTPNSTGYISINGGAQQQVNFIIDSGGVYGTIPSTVAGSATTSTGYLAPGTVVNVYNSSGALLYTYTTTKTNTPTVTTTSGDNTTSTVNGITAYSMNTGYEGFALGPVYINYLAGVTTITTKASDGHDVNTSYVGETDYDLWTS